MESSGHVTVNERAPSQRFNRFVEERVKEWMGEHQLSEDNSDYEVAFFDEDPLGEVSCLIVVQSGENMWRSWETADNPRLAFKRSLETLHQEKEQAAQEDAQSSITTTH